MKLSLPLFALLSAAFALPQTSPAETSAYTGVQGWRAILERLKEGDQSFLNRRERWRIERHKLRLRWHTAGIRPWRETPKVRVQKRRDKWVKRLENAGHRTPMRGFGRVHTREWPFTWPQPVPGSTAPERSGQNTWQEPASGIPRGNEALPRRPGHTPQIPAGSGAEVDKGTEKAPPQDEFAKTFVQSINAARSVPRQCGSQSYPAAPPVDWNEQLAIAASKHSNEMARFNYFSHTGSDGLSVGDRVTAEGYHWRAVGENIAAGMQSIQATVDAWLKSPGHCANIMNPAFTEMGAARADDPKSDYRTYWTLVLADR